MATAICAKSPVTKDVQGPYHRVEGAGVAAAEERAPAAAELDERHRHSSVDDDEAHTRHKAPAPQ